MSLYKNSNDYNFASGLRLFDNNFPKFWKNKKKVTVMYLQVKGFNFLAP